MPPRVDMPVAVGVPLPVNMHWRVDVPPSVDVPRSAPVAAMRGPHGRVMRGHSLAVARDRGAVVGDGGLVSGGGRLVPGCRGTMPDRGDDRSGGRCTSRGRRGRSPEPGKCTVARGARPPARGGAMGG
ncbi:MAG: hypothetical protein ACJ780_07220, partial [Solirubrobacteraceae bacterium]